MLSAALDTLNDALDEASSMRAKMIGELLRNAIFNARTTDTNKDAMYLWVASKIEESI